MSRTIHSALFLPAGIISIQVLCSAFVCCLAVCGNLLIYNLNIMLAPLRLLTNISVLMKKRYYNFFICFKEQLVLLLILFYDS